MNAANGPVLLALLVDALLADPARRRLLGHAARRRAVRQCSPERSVGAILALWQDLGARPAASEVATVPPVTETHKRKQVR